MKYRFLIGLFLSTFVVSAQIPDGYYTPAANMSGQQLRTALHSIIKNHTIVSYSDLWTAFYTTDARPDNGKVWDIYSDNPDGNTSYFFTFGDDQCGNYSSEGDCYNREHAVPKSWFNDASPMYSDLFHIYPTDGWVNNKRGNMPLGEVNNPSWTSTNGSKIGMCSTSGYSDAVFEPIDAYKGDLARSYFYFTVCYMDKNLGYGQSMFDNSSLKPWALEMMIQWHNEDPVSQKEIDRNNAIYQLQHNRNPFIDFPQLVGLIYDADSVNSFQPDGVEEIATLENCLIYPNPATENLRVELPNHWTEPITLRIWNLAGQLIYQETISETNPLTIVSLHDWKSGMYLLSLKTPKSEVIRKLIKQ